MILVVEPEHLISQLLGDLGHRILRLRYHECIKAPGRNVPRQIRNGEIIGICVAYHEWHKRIPKEVVSKFLKELEVWIRHAHGVGITFIIIGLTEEHWNHNALTLIQNQEVLFESKRRFCALNLKLRNHDAPSNHLCEDIKYSNA